MIPSKLVKPNPNRQWTFLFGALLLAFAARAFVMRPLSIQELTATANLVLHGSVTGKTVQRDPEGRIYTRVELQVIEAWKGQPKTNSFVLVQGGGVLGEETVVVDGQEEFSIGEEVVVFLVLNQRQEGVVIGVSQGKFKVHSEARGEKSARNLFHGDAPVAEQPAMTNARPRKITLTDLKRRVQGERP